MVSRNSRGSEKSTETHRQAGTRLVTASTSRSQNPIRTNSGPYHGHIAINAPTGRQNKANASMHHTNGNTRHHWITKTNSTWIITNTATHYTVRLKAMVRAPVWGSALTVAITPPKHHSCSKTSVASSGLRPRNHEAGTPASQRMSCNVRRQSFSTCCRSTATKRR